MGTWPETRERATWGSPGGSWAGSATATRACRPGQYDTGKSWPVLTAEATPKLDLATWTFTVDGLVDHPTTWTWDEIHALPPSTYEGDIHCVTTWSKLGMTFAGVSVDALLAIAGPQPSATHVMAHSHTGYTTNLPLADVTGGKAWVAWEADGASRSRASTAARPGCSCRTSTSGRARSGCRALELLDHDEPGFWERNGYHDRGDPWLEQRYQGD